MAPPSKIARDANRKAAMSKPPKIKFKLGVSFSSSDLLVTFLVGPVDKRAKFFVHKEVACAASPVFQTAFNSQVVEGQTQTYTLEDTTALAFRFLMQWMYKGELIIWSREMEDVREAMQATVPPYYEEDEEGSSTEAIEAAALTESWILADKLIMPELQNQIIKALLIWTEIVDLIECAQRIYELTSENSQLRKYLVEMTARFVDDEEIMRKADFQIPKQMLRDMFIWQRSYTAGHGYIPEDYYVPIEE